MDDQGNLSTSEEEGNWLMELLNRLDPEKVRAEALRRGLPELSLNLLIERANSDDPLERDEARAIIDQESLGLALPATEPEVPER